MLPLAVAATSVTSETSSLFKSCLCTVMNQEGFHHFMMMCKIERFTLKAGIEYMHIKEIFWTILSFYFVHAREIWI